MKKIIGLIIILALLALGIFYWRNNNKDVRELNRGLPEGVKIEKSLFGFGKDYRVVNKIDGYSFKVPEGVKGVRGLDYFIDEEQNSAGFIIETLSDDFLRIAKHKLDSVNIDLEQWVISVDRQLSGVYSKRDKEQLGNISIIKAKEDDSDIAINYFLKDELAIYELRGLNTIEESIREIISNGNW